MVASLFAAATSRRTAMAQVFVGRGRAQPDQLVLLGVERPHLFISGLAVLPDRVGVDGKEERAVAGVFGIDVDLAGDERAADDLGRPELKLVGGLDPVGLEQLDHHAAEQPALRVDLRTDPHDVLSIGARGHDRERDPGKGGTRQFPKHRRFLPGD
jgi:hypothetical protein